MGPDYGRNTSRCTTRRGVFGHELDGQGTEKHPVCSDRIIKTVLKLSESQIFCQYFIENECTFS